MRRPEPDGEESKHQAEHRDQKIKPPAADQQEEASRSAGAKTGTMMKTMIRQRHDARHLAALEAVAHKW